MPDFGDEWTIKQSKPLGRGGQGNVYLVERAATHEVAAAKVLNGAYDANSARWKRIEEEIGVSKSFDHPNVIKVLDSGHTRGKGFPFYVMPHYPGGPLPYDASLSSLQILRLFADICAGVAHVHSKGIIHRDLKPANIFIDGAGHPIVGDFGLCFRLEAESQTETREVATARWWGAPELRDGHLDHPLPTADVYSLGKILYWLFTGNVWDRDEEAYGPEDRKLRVVLESRGIDLEMATVDDRLLHAGAMADTLIEMTVRYDHGKRLGSVDELIQRTLLIIERLEHGGRSLDLRVPQRCRFCAGGKYEPLSPLPTLKQRMVHNPNRSPDAYEKMRNLAVREFGTRQGGVGAVGPLILICRRCGHVEQFRLDLVENALMNWLP